MALPKLSEMSTSFQHFLTMISHDFCMLPGVGITTFLVDWTVVSVTGMSKPSCSRGQLVFLSPWLRRYLEDNRDNCGYILDTCGYDIFLMIARQCLKEGYLRLATVSCLAWYFLQYPSILLSHWMSISNGWHLLCYNRFGGFQSMGVPLDHPF